MRATWRAEESGRAYKGTRGSQTASGTSVPAPIGGWDSINPIANMPPQNAFQLINWFPQPNWVELRRGHIIFCDTGTGAPVETVMGYMSQDTSDDALLAASDGEIFDVTSGTPSSVGMGYSSDRWQHTNFAGTGGSFLYMVNGEDDPQYFQSGTITIPTITPTDSSDPADFINICIYRSRVWFVRKNSTIAYYLDVDSVAGDAHPFDVGNQFVNGGYLVAIGTFSTDTAGGPTEYIIFLSSQGDAAIYNIMDPTDTGGISFRGRAEISQPVGYRCLAKLGNDLSAITLDGVLPLSQVLTYDRSTLIGKSLTANIRSTVTQTVRDAKDHFGWSFTSYPRNTMLILNVPIEENGNQEQYVMNSITGAWCRFTGQYANCWDVFLDKPYFGDNDGLVHLADEAGGDENQTLTADLGAAWNYFGDQSRSQLKRWPSIRPNITIDQTFPVNPLLGVNVDFGTNATLYPITFNATTETPLWDVALWDVAVWPGDVISFAWASCDAIGYVASVRMTVTLPWDPSLLEPKALRLNSFDWNLSPGGLI